MVKLAELPSPVARPLAARASPTAAKAVSCVSGKAAARRKHVKGHKSRNKLKNAKFRSPKVRLAAAGTSRMPPARRWRFRRTKEKDWWQPARADCPQPEDGDSEALK